MIFLATGVSDIDSVLVDLFLLLLVAKIGEEIFQWLKQPVVIGQILGGILLGPSLLGLVDLSLTLEVFSELGAIILLFWVGLNMHIEDLFAVRRWAVRVGLLGAVVPFAGGILLGLLLGQSLNVSMFIGAALVATSVGITAAVLSDLGALKSRPAQVILAGGVVDDIVAMILLSVTVSIAANGSVDVLNLVKAGALVCVFLFIAYLGVQLAKRKSGLFVLPRFADGALLPTLLLCLGLAALASEVGLAAIIGAFFAGLIASEVNKEEPFTREVEPLYLFLAPFFFVLIGIRVDLDALLNVDALLVLLLVVGVAIATKLVGSYIGARQLGRSTALFTAVGMIPRGEVGIVVASIGQVAGILDQRLFAIIVAMSVITSLITPPLLRLLARRDLAEVG